MSKFKCLVQVNSYYGCVCRCLVKNSSAVVEVEFERPVCLEMYKDYKDLGRFMLRQGGHTIAAGLVEEVISSFTALML